MQTVAVLALDGVIPFDLAIPLDVFGRLRLPDGRAAYRVLVCGPSETVDAGLFAMQVPHGLDALLEADTLVLPGLADPTVPLSPEVAEAIREAAARGVRVITICVGTFLLAATGLLDGKRATTHWAATGELMRRHPRVAVDPDVLFVDNGQFLTSAGGAAGLDLCLHVIRKDHGAAIAANAARVAVMPLERDGGQAQFIHHAPPGADGLSLEPLLRWAEAHAAEDLTLNDLARAGMMSVRTLNRRFQEQTGTTPLQWLNRARIRHAQRLLETTPHPIERIAAEVGFQSVTAFRERFRRLAGTSPQAYRRAFGSRERLS